MNVPPFPPGREKQWPHMNQIAWLTNPLRCKITGIIPVRSTDNRLSLCLIHWAIRNMVNKPKQNKGRIVPNRGISKRKFRT
jgi:hypothetical protein